MWGAQPYLQPLLLLQALRLLLSQLLLQLLLPCLPGLELLWRQPMEALRDSAAQGVRLGADRMAAPSRHSVCCGPQRLHMH